MELTQDHVFFGVQVEIAHLVRYLLEVLAYYLVHDLLLAESLDSLGGFFFRVCLVEHICAHCARLMHECQTTHDRIESLRNHKPFLVLSLFLDRMWAKLNDTLLKMGDGALEDVSDELLQVFDG